MDETGAAGLNQRSYYMKRIIIRDAFYEAALIAIICIGIALLSQSCASPRWYTRTHSGCQQSQGFAGYGSR